MLTIVSATILSIIAAIPASQTINQGIVGDKTLPQIVCVNDNVDGEIRHFLENNQWGESEDTRYWNLIRESTDIKGDYTGILYRQEDNIPLRGNAYLEYGNDIIVIQGKVDKALFGKNPGKGKKITMRNNNSAKYIYTPYLKFSVNSVNDSYLRSKCNIESSANIDSLSGFTQKRLPVMHDDEEYEVDSTILLSHVICKNTILDKEIRHYFSHFPKDEQVRYWNLLIWKQPYTYCDSTVYKCTLHLEPRRPEPGVAYLDYGNNIIVVEEDLDVSLFAPSEGPKRAVNVIINRIPEMHSYPYMVFYMTNISFLKSYSECTRHVSVR